MTTVDLQRVVAIEGVCLVLIVLIILSSFKRWRVLLYASSAVAAVAFYSAWNVIMATAAILVYGPASLLMWMELDKKAGLKNEVRRKIIRTTCWAFVITGVTALILKNIFNIYRCLA